ncbi:uncharacterized protein BDZ99DRAFT_571672 [Mytilinidion resinicola]|uniref:Uncharacterized protein n=1 Tax=Mytilinidion resinicola TaxID=574789 RepID=A0A6A6YLP4_9PEZI|nr:uncharacterized protein BDZ99DRAFT_571672 [Mytilinidion resinicola]KAF2808787.1 hypothetical protein BDZ99DRAFT_571672 [Mytilinidion resinicola]
MSDPRTPLQPQSRGDNINIAGVVLASIIGVGCLVFGILAWREARRRRLSTHSLDDDYTLPFYQPATNASREAQAPALAGRRAAQSMFPPNLHLERCRYYTEMTVERWREAT